jgi:hypothetical protein
MCAIEQRSGRMIIMWRDELLCCQQAPFDVDDDAVMVAYMAAAELSCFEALGWRHPMHVLDLYIETIATINGDDSVGLVGDKRPSLLEALQLNGLEQSMTKDEKGYWRKIILENHEYTSDQKTGIQAYKAAMKWRPAPPHVPVQIAAATPAPPPRPVVPKTAAEEMADRRRAATILAIGAALAVPEPARMLAESSTSVEAAERILLLCTPDRGWCLAQRRSAGEPALSPPPTAAESGWLAAYARLKQEQELLVRPHYCRADRGR